jgi:hypothetical protein
MDGRIQVGVPVDPQHGRGYRPCYEQVCQKERQIASPQVTQ